MPVTDKECSKLNNILMNSETLDLVLNNAQKIGFELLEINGDPTNPGFLGAAFRKIGENEIVIAHRGTAPRWCTQIDPAQLAKCPKVFGKDGKDNLRIALDEVPKQFHRSEALLANAKSKYPEHNIVLTGFSLGGVYANYLE